MLTLKLLQFTKYSLLSLSPNMKCVIKQYLFLCGLFFYSGIINAQTITTISDKDSILIGEQIQYKVETKFAQNKYTLHWVEVPDSFLHFEVINRNRPDTVVNNGIISVSQVITLTSFDSGLNTIPSFPLTLEPNEGGGGGIRELHTDTLLVNVLYSPLDSTKTFHDIKTIIEVQEPFPIWKWIGAIIALLLLLGFILFLYRYFKKKKKEEDLFSGRLSPFDEAMSSLEKLSNTDLLLNGQIKDYYSSLTDIFKKYISRKTRTNLLNHTSADLLLLMQSNGIKPEYISETSNALRMSDAVKFAKFRPVAQESISALNSIKNIIIYLNHSATNDSSK